MIVVEDGRGALTVRLFPNEAGLIGRAIREGGESAPSREGNSYLRAVSTALEIYALLGLRDLGLVPEPPPANGREPQPR